MLMLDNHAVIGCTLNPRTVVERLKRVSVYPPDTPIFGGDVAERKPRGYDLIADPEEEEDDYIDEGKDDDDEIEDFVDEEEANDDED